MPFIIEGGEKGGMTGAIYRGEKLDLRALAGEEAWPGPSTARPGSPPSPGRLSNGRDVVVLEVDNRTTFDQPLHIHGHVWRRSSAGNAGRRTMARYRGHSAEEAVQAGFVADNPGDWGIQ